MFKFLCWVWGIALGLLAIAVFTPATHHPTAAALPTEQQSSAAPVRQTPVHLGYDEVARHPDHHIGKAVVFSGKVVQVLNEGNSLFMRVAVTRDKYGFWQYDDIVLLRYRDHLKSDGRFLDKDIVEFRGIFKGVQNYNAIFGQTIQKPVVTACDVRVISNSSPRAPRDCT